MPYETPGIACHNFTSGGLHETRDADMMPSDTVTIMHFRDSAIGFVRTDVTQLKVVGAAAEIRSRFSVRRLTTSESELVPAP